MKNSFKTLAVLCGLLVVTAGLTGCVTDLPTPPAQPPLTQVQTAAKTVLQVVTADVTAYEQVNPTLDPTVKGDLDQAVKDLGVAVANLTSLQAGEPYQVYVAALLNVLNSVVTNLPDSVLSANTKAEVQTGIALAQGLLALLPTQAALASVIIALDHIAVVIALDRAA